MRKIIFYIVAFIATTLLTSFVSVPADKGIIGKWKGKDNEQTGSFIFDKDGYATMVVGKESKGGRRYVEQNTAMSMTYEVNPKTSPKQIDLVITMLESKQEVRMLGIYEYITTKKIRMRVNTTLGTARPTEFGDPKGDDTIVLDKVE